jgi:pimeloyl-ACP methyl ester carboxylesterase
VDHLKRLPNAKVIIVPNGRHLCHRSNPEFFHRVAVNFLDVVLDKFVRPAIVSMV